MTTKQSTPPKKTVFDYPPLDKIDADQFFERAKHTGQGFNENPFKLVIHNTDFDSADIKLLHSALVELLPLNQLVNDYHLSNTAAVMALINKALANFRVQLKATGLCLVDVVLTNNEIFYGVLARMDESEIKLVPDLLLQ